MPSSTGRVGPILKVKADRAGVVYTNVDGDQPGVMMNLYRFVKGIGVRPVLCGNIKGLHDPYRTRRRRRGSPSSGGRIPAWSRRSPTARRSRSSRRSSRTRTGMRVAKRGMHGPTVATGTPIQEVAQALSARGAARGPGHRRLRRRRRAGPGVFVLGTHDDPRQRHYLNLYKLGEGPLYCFYTPYHLCHFEVPNTVARAVLFGDAAIAPIGAPLVEVDRRGEARSQGR